MPCNNGNSLPGAAQLSDCFCNTGYGNYTQHGDCLACLPGTQLQRDENIHFAALLIFVIFFAPYANNRLL
jgi:hypothetical protein